MDEAPIRSWFKRDSFGRYEVWPDPRAIAFGRTLRRARRLAGLSQRQLAARSGVSQSGVSRFERGMAPGMSTERLIMICDAVGRSMPFGFCPHDHVCPWPRIEPVEYDRPKAGQAAPGGGPPLAEERKAGRADEMYRRLVQRISQSSRRNDGRSILEIVREVVEEVDAEMSEEADAQLLEEADAALGRGSAVMQLTDSGRVRAAGRRPHANT